MAREDWEHLFRCTPSHLFRHEQGGIFEGMGLFDKKEKTALLIDIFGLLAVSPQCFMDILNSHKDSPLHLITNHELEFRQSGDAYYFEQEAVFGLSDFTVHEEDFKTWLDDNYRLLKAWQSSEIDAKVLAERLDYQDVVEALEFGEMVDTPSIEKLQAENEKLKARIAELENALQKATAGVKKAVDERERKTFLKLIHAALSLGRKFPVSDRSLASLLAKKTQELYPSKPVNNDTAKNKLNEIIKLYEEISE